tara:strand:- start:78 stop:368 length:291 start_codon:yes stop_codon:yes gene_type:complete
MTSPIKIHNQLYIGIPNPSKPLLNFDKKSSLLSVELFMQQVVRNKILIAIIHRKKDFTSEEKDAPPIKPAARVIIMLTQNTYGLRPILVHLPEPQL